MRLSPRLRQTLRATALVATLFAVACADSTTPDAGPTTEASSDDLSGRWSAVQGPGTLVLRPDGTFTLHHDLGGAPYEGTYMALEDGRVRLDIPSLAPFIIERDGDALSFRAPGADRQVRYERS